MSSKVIILKIFIKIKKTYFLGYSIKLKKIENRKKCSKHGLILGSLIKAELFISRKICLIKLIRLNLFIYNDI
jgi:hypothetical protein